MKTQTWPDAFGYTIFCDDIRTEHNNKNILIGVYNNEIILTAPFPAILAKLVMEIHYLERPGTGTGPLTLRICLPGDPEEEPSIVSEIEGDFRNIPLPEADDPRVGFVLAVALSPLEIKEQGRIRVRAVRGDEVVRLGSMLVRSVAPLSTDEPKPT